MDWDDETARAARQQKAARLREQAQAGGLAFDAYLPPTIAEWVLDAVAAGVFRDPSEAVFVAMQSFIDLAPHQDLKIELLRRMIQASIDDPRPSLTGEEMEKWLEELAAKPRVPAACWEKDALRVVDG